MLRYVMPLCIVGRQCHLWKNVNVNEQEKTEKEMKKTNKKKEMEKGKENKGGPYFKKKTFPICLFTFIH